ncbi:ABC transporter ATP-binding protein [uncultured Bosea sp.]|uniref:ABC transporter ATP-binding protein n=1 Tax=uncultured Bosea sp. TaxID=211457 RepID=UPI0025D4C0DC|nr:ABC transporter ATP-binding protein [uncultured Bosea sp.]
MTAPLLELRNLRTRFRTDRGDLDAVRDVSFTLRAGETLGLVGESGSGKSVTGFSIMGLIDPPGRIVGGEILFRGQDLTRLDEEAMRCLRGNRIAMVFQDPMMTLNPVLRISTQMIETIRAHETIDDATARIRARDLLGAMGIPSPEARLDAYPHQLSGGMRQRVAIAIALINKPDLIIADEPTTALDVSIQAQILAEVQQLTRESGTALLWITHDLSVIAGIADEIAVMYAGRIVEQGSVDAVLDQPSHPYTAGLIGSLPGASAPGSMLVQIPGTTPDMVDPPQGCAFGPRCSRHDEACERQPAFTEGAHRLRCFHPLSGPASAAELPA